ncbi:acetyl-CoA hydrolase/transferase C-terminal domain-containing protein [Nocardia sp. NPDC051787]|uniref:acetyl-CoA hydrolase/transferase family protein n=1 Tax=Nocardia sp. NPDC051787 TaxID=3155415 RepID=UPI00342B22F7
MSVDDRLPYASEIDLTNWIRKGDLVAWSQGAAEPVSLVERLLEQRHAIGEFRVLLGTSYAGLVTPAHADVISFIGFGAVGGSTQQLAAQRRLGVIPVNLSEVPRLLRNGRVRVDVLVLQVSNNGGKEYRLGAVNGYVHEAIAQARTVIAEVNTNAPWPTSSTVLPADAFSLMVQSNRPLVEVREREPTPEDREIARRVAQHIGDGATLQLGIGGVPAAVATLLTDRKHLGLHSGVIGDSVLALLRSGAIDNSRKTRDHGVSVTGLLAGTSDLYDFADHNPALRIEPVTYTHDPAVLASMPSFTAINSALEVDLTGQVGAEVAHGSYIGTIGGQADFARGALASPGGCSIIGLPARTRRTQEPRIVPLLRSGIVSTPRSEADVVVTEYGAAHLRGATLEQRVERMIAIAHPEDRSRLREEATRLVGTH